MIKITLMLLLLSVLLEDSALNATTVEPTAIPTIREVCAKLNTSCNVCVANSKCFYCETATTVKCLPYPAGHVFPSPSDCKPDFGSARWGTCHVNFKILLIAMGVLAGIIFIIVPCLIYCCCRSRGSAKATIRHQREEEKWSREEAVRKERSNERRAQREEMYSEIRAKYGLPNSKPPYSRMENA